MSDEDTIGAGDRQDLTAAEYVLGVLGAEERRRAEFRIASEPRFAAEVAYWEARLGPLAERVPRSPRRSRSGTASRRGCRLP